MRSACLPSPTRPGLALCLTLFLVAGALPAKAQFNYYTANGKIIITGYTGMTGNVVVPSRIDGKPVAEIEDHAFSGNNVITSITLPGTLRRIGRSAFESCGQLRSIAIPDGVVEIGDYAFQSCYHLTEARLGTGLTRLGDSAFAVCDQLAAITVAAGNPAYSSLAGVLFNKRKTRLIQYPPAKSGAYAIPSGVASAETVAFWNCIRLTRLSVPASFTNLEGGLFGNCPQLARIDIASGNPLYRSRDGVVFNKPITRLVRCPPARSGAYSIPASVTALGDFAFDECSRLTRIAIPSGVTSIGEFAFHTCSGLTAISLPPRLGEIAAYTFTGCSRLTDIRIPDHVARIGMEAFERCTRLARVIVGKGVTDISTSAFGECPRLTTVCFQGNRPYPGWGIFTRSPNARVYYLPWRSGWGATFGSRATRSGDAFETDNSRARAKPIANGQTQLHCIHAAGNEDWVKFAVGAAGARHVRLDTAGSAGDLEMWLYKGNGQLVKYDDNSGPGRFPRISLAALPPGTYYLRLREFGNNARLSFFSLRVTWTTP